MAGLEFPTGIAEVLKVLLQREVLACGSVIWHGPIGALKSRRGGVGGGEPNPGNSSARPKNTGAWADRQLSTFLHFSPDGLAFSGGNYYSRCYAVGILTRTSGKNILNNLVRLVREPLINHGNSAKIWASCKAQSDPV